MINFITFSAIVCFFMSIIGKIIILNTCIKSEYVLRFLYACFSISWSPSLFSIGMLSCLPLFVNFASTFSVKMFCLCLAISELNMTKNVVCHRLPIFLISFNQQLNKKKNSKCIHVSLPVETMTKSSIIYDMNKIYSFQRFK